MSLEDQVLKRVVPSEEEEARLRATVDDVLARVRVRLEELGEPGEPLLVGSVAKGTHLSDAEIDVFVRFPREVPRERLEKVGLALGAFLKDKVRQYAEHPYTRGRWRGFEVEIVPCYRIADASEKMSAVDRTPLHAEYVLQRLGPKQRDEVRVLKAFCEGIGVYGAEAKVQGFSGYLCELLVLRFGTFRGALQAARSWRRGEVLTLGEPPSKPFQDPLVFADPIDAGRNVASAVGDESLATFLHAARAFLAKPAIAFFFPPKARVLTVSQAYTLLRRRGTTLLAVSLPAPKLTDDILYPQVRKALRATGDALDRAGFRVRSSRGVVAGGRAVLLFEFEVYALPAVEKHMGPPYWVSNSADFLRRWIGDRRAMSRPHLEGDRWVVDVRRAQTDALAFLRARLPKLGLGADLDRVAKKARYLKDAQALTRACLPEVTRLLAPRFPWERPSRR